MYVVDGSRDLMCSLMSISCWGLSDVMSSTSSHDMPISFQLCLSRFSAILTTSRIARIVRLATIVPMSYLVTEVV